MDASSGRSQLVALWVEPQPKDYEAGIQRLQEYPDQGITLCDATIAAVAQRLGLPIWTYDFHFDVMLSPVWR
ncbi:MAG: hypothetical protein VKK80_16925 [Prochlorothrix sp.]|nr:hypothetical protein [Prochlorothrix sp.]